MQEVSIGLKPERRVSVGGDIVELEELGDVLEAKFPTDRENVVVRLTCEDSVGMALVSEVHEILVGLDLMKVIYEGPAAEGLPLVLPSLDLQEKLEEVMAKHGMLVKVDLPGRAIVDGKPVKLTGIKKAIQERLATDPHLVVSLVWAPTSRFEDFMMVLALAKEAGAQRIAVQIGS
jgi:biopolymer transport protein ExbD